MIAGEMTYRYYAVVLARHTGMCTVFGRVDNNLKIGPPRHLHRIRYPVNVIKSSSMSRNIK